VQFSQKDSLIILLMAGLGPLFARDSYCGGGSGHVRAASIENPVRIAGLNRFGASISASKQKCVVVWVVLSNSKMRTDIDPHNGLHSISLAAKKQCILVRPLLILGVRQSLMLARWKIIKNKPNMRTAWDAPVGGTVNKILKQ
jgi:hypothetical protein